MIHQKVDDDVVKYYENCKKNYENFVGDDQYDIALQTVASLNKYGIRVCRHTMITELMERIVKEYESPEIIVSLFKALNTDLESVISSKYASHLLEKVLWSCKNADIANDDLVKFHSSTFCEYMWLHYPEYLENNIGSHIVRIFFQFVCGVYVTVEGKVYSPNNAVIATPMQFDHKERLSGLVKRFLLSANIDQIIANELMSATLQTILVICCVSDQELFKTVAIQLMKSFCDISEHVSKKAQDSIEVPDSFLNQHKCYLIECLILCLPDKKLYNRFTKKYLQIGRDNFITTSLNNPTCCAILKASVKRCKNPELLSEIAQCVQDNLSKLEDFQCGNVFLHLLLEFLSKFELFSTNDHENFRKYKNYLLEIIQHLARGVTDTPTLSRLLTAGLKDHDEPDEEVDDNARVREHEKVCSVPASKVMQSVLSSYTPIPKSISKMFLNLPTDKIMELCTNGKGSRVIESFFATANISDDTKAALFKDLNDEQIHDLAVDRFGSRVLDATWAQSVRPIIELVRSKLEAKRSTLQYHRIGKFIERKFFGHISKPTLTTANKQSTNNNRKRHNGGPQTDANVKRQKFMKK